MKAFLEVPKIVVFSDVNMDVHLDSPFELVFNETAIKKSLENIFMTPYGSRPFRRRFGSKILDLLYEPVTNGTSSRLSTMLRETTELWETRVSDVKILVLPDFEKQQYYVEMTYRVPSLGNKMVNYKFNVSK